VGADELAAAEAQREALGEVLAGAGFEDFELAAYVLPQQRLRGG
jgi:hypothetical protein